MIAIMILTDRMLSESRRLFHGASHERSCGTAPLPSLINNLETDTWPLLRCQGRPSVARCLSV